MKTRANFAFPSRDLKKWKIAAAAEGISLTEFMTKAANGVVSAANKPATAGSDPRLDVVIQALQKLHDFPAMILLMNKIYRGVDEIGKITAAMTVVDDAMRDELLQRHPELKNKYQQ